MKNVPLTLFLSLVCSIIFLFPNCTTEDTPIKDNTVRLRFPAEPSSLNPATMRSYGVFVTRYLFQYLTDFDSETLELVPNLVKSAPIETPIEEGEYAGGYAFTYEIHELADWDNGTPVTGYDYEFSLKALFNPLVPSKHFRAYLDHIREIEVDATNPKKFTVYSDRTYILAEATISNINVFPKYHYDPADLLKDISFKELANPATAEKLQQENANIKTFAEQFQEPKYTREEIVGSGPYKLVEWIEKQRLVMVRKKDWWGDKVANPNITLLAYPDTIIILPIKDDNALGSAIKDGTIDAAISVNTTVFKDLQQNPTVQDQFNFHTPEAYLFFYICMNGSKVEKIKDKRVRRALAHCLDIDKIIEVAYDGMGVRIVNGLPSEQNYANSELPLIPFDLDKARNLLAEAGWSDSNNNGIVDKEINGELTELSLQYYFTGSAFSKRMVPVFVDNAQKAGIEILPEEIDHNTLVGVKYPARDFEMAGAASGSDPVAFADPKQFWHTNSDTPSGTNRAGFGNAATDALIDSIRVTLDKEKQFEMHYRLQEIIYEEQPYIFLFTPLERLVVHKRFEAKGSKFKPGLHANLFKLKIEQ